MRKSLTVFFFFFFFFGLFVFLVLGSLYNTPFMAARSGKYGWSCQEWVKSVQDIQKKVLDLGYPPLLIGLDSLHGTNYILDSTIFPHVRFDVWSFSRGMRSKYSEEAVPGKAAPDKNLVKSRIANFNSIFQIFIWALQLMICFVFCRTLDLRRLLTHFWLSWREWSPERTLERAESLGTLVLLRISHFRFAISQIEIESQSKSFLVISQLRTFLEICDSRNFEWIAAVVGETLRNVRIGSVCESGDGEIIAERISTIGYFERQLWFWRLRNWHTSSSEIQEIPWKSFANLIKLFLDANNDETLGRLLESGLRCR